MTELHEDSKRFAQIIAATSQYFEDQGLGIEPLYVEKDYWITRSLRLLSLSSYANDIVFKGGTSLSKGYQLTQRFSEDIDIAVIDANRFSGNQLKNLIHRAAKSMTAGLEELPMENGTRKGSRYYKAYFHYPDTANVSSRKPIMSGKLLVEINSFGNPYPYEKVLITSFVEQFLKAIGRTDILVQYAMQPFELNVLDKRRTMLEKIVSLLRFSFSEGQKDLPAKIRHFYDLHFLSQDASCQSYLLSQQFRDDLLDLYQHDQQEFSQPESWQGKTIRESPLFTQIETIWQRLTPTYNTELPELAYTANIPPANMIYDSFGKILSLLKEK